MERIKQVILIRKDLKMRRGKEIAQGSHASMQFLTQQIITQQTVSQPAVQNLHPDDKQNVEVSVNLSPLEANWLSHGMAKVCLRVDSEQELLSHHEKALASGLTSCLITDSGRTEFKGKPTITACAIGPDLVSRIDAITGDLTPY